MKIETCQIRTENQIEYRFILNFLHRKGFKSVHVIEEAFTGRYAFRICFFTKTFGINPFSLESTADYPELSLEEFMSLFKKKTMNDVIHKHLGLTGTPLLYSSDRNVINNAFDTLTEEENLRVTNKLLVIFFAVGRSETVLLFDNIRRATAKQLAQAYCMAFNLEWQD